MSRRWPCRRCGTGSPCGRRRRWTECRPTTCCRAFWPPCRSPAEHAVAITGRFVLLALAGIIPLLLFPRPATALVWCLLLAAAVGVDLALALSPRRVGLQRRLPANVRLGESVTARLLLANHGRRPLRAVLRDGWQPSAGAANPDQRVRISPGERRLLEVQLTPQRRGDLLAHHVAIRSLGPLGMAARQMTIDLPGRLRVLPPFHSKRHLPSKLRKLRELDGRVAVQIRGAGTEFDSLRDYVRGDDV